MQALETRDLTLKYGDSVIIEELQLTIPKGQITVLIGSNGCGKSTLLRSMARLLKPYGGSVLLDGHDVHHLATKEVAKRLAILPQGPTAPEGLTVLQLVKQGRYPYQNWLRQWSEMDEAAVRSALKATGMEELSERPLDALSGGQRQRAWIAMTLAQGTETILLDEPTTYLDLTHQIEVLDLLFELNETEQRTIVMVLHDINLACRYADHIVAIKNRKVYTSGKPEDVVHPEMVKEVFGMDCRVIPCPLFGTPTLIPEGRGRRVSAAKERTFEHPLIHA